MAIIGRCYKSLVMKYSVCLEAVRGSEHWLNSIQNVMSKVGTLVVGR